MSRRTRERKEREEAEQAEERRRNVRRIPLRLLQRLFRAAVAIVFVTYIAMTGDMTWNWFMTKITRLQSIDSVAKVARDDLSGPDPDPEALRNWLARRPMSEGEELMKRLEPFVGQMSGMTFILYASWEVNAGKIDEAVFWRQYARYRIRYDVLRCGSYNAIGLMTDIINRLPQASIKERMMETPENLPAELRRVLDYDEKHPPLNNPAQFCKALTKFEAFKSKTNIIMTSPEDWTGIHTTLRGITFMEMRHMEEEQRKDKAKENGDKTPAVPQEPAPCPKSGKLKNGKPCKAKEPAKP